MVYLEQKEIREAQVKLAKPEGLDRGEPKVHEGNQEDLVALEYRVNPVMMADQALPAWLDHKANRAL